MLTGGIWKDLTCLLWLLSLLSGIYGKDPSITMAEFTRDKDCPKDGVDYLDSYVTVDMAGVDTTKWISSVSIADQKNNDIVRTSFDSCANSNINDFYCNGTSGDMRSFVYHKTADEKSSGKQYQAKMNNDLFTISEKSPNKRRYPIVENAPIETLIVNDMVVDVHKKTNVEVNFDSESENITVLYNVSGIDWTTYTVSISNPAGDVLASSSSNVEVQASVSKSDGVTVGYSIVNSCKKKVTVEFKSSKTGPDDKCGNGCIAGVTVVIVVILCTIIIVIVIICCKRISVVCSKKKTIGGLRNLVKENPKVKKRVQGLQIRDYHFFQKKCLEENKLGDDVKVIDLNDDGKTISEPSLKVTMDFSVVKNTIACFVIKSVKGDKTPTPEPTEIVTVDEKDGEPSPQKSGNNVDISLLSTQGNTCM